MTSTHAPMNVYANASWLAAILSEHAPVDTCVAGWRCGCKHVTGEKTYWRHQIGACADQGVYVIEASLVDRALTEAVNVLEEVSGTPSDQWFDESSKGPNMLYAICRYVATARSRFPVREYPEVPNHLLAVTASTAFATHHCEGISLDGGVLHHGCVCGYVLTDTEFEDHLFEALLDEGVTFGTRSDLVQLSRQLRQASIGLPRHYRAERMIAFHDAAMALGAELARAMHPCGR